VSRDLSSVSDPVQAPDRAPSAAIRVVLADDHPQVRHAMRDLLDADAGIDVVGEANALDTALAEVEHSHPDVLTLGVRSASGSLLEALAAVHSRSPETHIVVVTMQAEPAHAQRALAEGALGFVSKELADVELPIAIRAAALDLEFVSPCIAA
jgi:DNA-binding NarL/FixJ family response regulator